MNAPRSQLLPKFDESAYREHFTWMYGKRRATLAVAFYNRDTQKLTERFYSWPRQADALAKQIDAVYSSDKPVEVWYCPTPRDGEQRDKNGGTDNYITWAEVDKPLSEDDFQWLVQSGFRIVASGTPGRHHVYGKTSRKITLDEQWAINCGLRAVTDGDNVIADNAYLKAVGTWNRKDRHQDEAKRNDQAYPVTLIAEGRAFDPDELRQLLEDRLGKPLDAVVGQTPSRRLPGALPEPDMTVKVRGKLKHHNRVAQALYSPLPDGSRFKALNRLVANCLEVGMTRDEIHVMCFDYEPAVEKFDIEQNGRLREQIDTCWQKVLYKKIAEGWDIEGDTEDGSAVLLPKASERSPSVHAPEDDLDFADADIIEDEPLPASLRFDFAAMADGSFVPTLPTMLARNDGKFLLYPGLTHWLYGRAGAGKSFVALFAVVEALKAGREVLYLDYEMSPRRVWDVLVNVLGVEPAAVQKQFIYHRVEGSFGQSPAYEALLEQLLGEASSAALAVVDGVNKSMQQEGWNPNENGDVNQWLSLLPNRIVKRTGAAVVCIDHANHQGKLLGSVAKAAGVTGAIYKLDVHKGHVLGKGRTGVLNLEVEKDREGSITEIAETHFVRFTYSYHDMIARVTVKSGEDGRIQYDIAPHPAQDEKAADRRKAKNSAGGETLVPEAKLIGVSNHFEHQPTKLFSQNQVVESEFVTGNKQDVKAAIEHLVTAGCVEEVRDRGKYPKYRYKKAYRTPEDAIIVDFSGGRDDDEQFEADDYSEDL